MKKILLVLSFLFLMVVPVCAEPDNTVPVGDPVVAKDTINVGDASTDGKALIAKTEQMAKDLHQMASKLIIPITVMVLIVGGLVGIFLPLARQILIFAILGLVLILWAPMLVAIVANWASL